MSKTLHNEFPVPWGEDHATTEWHDRYAKLFRKAGFKLDHEAQNTLTYRRRRVIGVSPNPLVMLALWIWRPNHMLVFQFAGEAARSVVSLHGVAPARVARELDKLASGYRQRYA